MKKIFLMLLVISVYAFGAAKVDEQALEQGLLNAMRLKPGTMERSAESGPMILAYVRAGYVDLKPDLRDNYIDYRLFRKPAHLMGQTLLIIEEEYLIKHLGCCVREGIGVTFRIDGNTSQLEKFAEQNGCGFIPNVDLNTELGELGIKTPAPEGKYAKLSCRYSDLPVEGEK